MTLDRTTAERLRKGDYPISARLDLHGMTLAEAHAAFEALLARAEAEALRCLLIITGKGQVLKDELPRWLARPEVLMFTHAQPKHGGEGALYVLLRRQRPAS